jgi:hypothetical protein
MRFDWTGFYVKSSLKKKAKIALIDKNQFDFS